MQQGEGSSEEEEEGQDVDVAAEVRLVPQDSAKGECSQWIRDILPLSECAGPHFCCRQEPMLLVGASCPLCCTCSPTSQPSNLLAHFARAACSWWDLQVTLWLRSPQPGFWCRRCVHVTLVPLAYGPALWCVHVTLVPLAYGPALWVCMSPLSLYPTIPLCECAALSPRSNTEGGHPFHWHPLASPLLMLHILTG